jgi:SpoVK/Ycf46/Vps4 family AAA+-type ATPase
MAVSRISKIKIKERGLFTAVYGNVNQDEFFVDDDLKKYNLWSQLYSYLKNEGYEMVLFYDTTNNFHSFSQTDLIKFLGLNISNPATSSVVQKEKYVARHIKSPFRNQRLNQPEKPKETQLIDSSPLHRSIQLVTEYGSSNNYYRTTITESDSLLTFFKKFLADTNRKVAVVIKYPDNSSFDFVDQYLTLFRELNTNYKKDDSENKIIIVYGCSNSEALIDNLNRHNNYLFVNDYFKNLFLNAEGDSHRVKPETTFELILPEQIELRNWLNRKRLMKGIHLFNSVPLDKITLRFIQERKRLSDFENYDIPKFISDISTKSGWDKLNEMIGLDSVKTKVRDIVDDLKYKRAHDMQFTFRPHLCFLGNPGTGKTTVASIVSEIFKEEGIVPLGHYTSTKATELMGQYVGEAAKLVRKKCEEARGGILFIDEAYAFIEEGTKVYGDSAVTELIAWLEDKTWQKETIVILAGYPDEISDLFKKSNKGLRGRFTDDHFLTFENYKPNELLEIFELNAKKNRISISKEAAELLEKIFIKQLQANKENKHWDNARRVENIFKLIFTNLRKRNSSTIEIQDIPKDLSSIVSGKSVTDIKETIEYIKLQRLIGLQNVKQSIDNLIESIEFEQNEIENGRQLEKSIQPLHLVFSGPPGTGKTTVAELFGMLLKNLGILSKGHVEKALRNDLVAGYVGQTALKTKEKIDKAMGGVLFIDEAYTLSNGGENDFGREAIDTLLPIMENERDKFVVIAAGYESNMNHFLQSNPGLNDRFNQRILFQNLAEEELIQVFNLFCFEEGKIFDAMYKCILVQYFSLLKQRDSESFSNSRAVRKLFAESKTQQQKRLNTLRKTLKPSDEEYQRLKGIFILEDVSEAIKILNVDLYSQIDFNCTSGSIPRTESPITVKEEPKVIKEEKPIEPEKKIESNSNVLKEVESAIKELLFDYCIIDTNIWMNENQMFRKHNLNSIRVLMNLYYHYQKNLIAHGKTYEELKRIRENKEGKYPKEVSFAAGDGFRLLSDANEKNLIAIPELAGEHDRKAYADLAIYEYASNTYKSGKTVALISNDKDCRIRVRSVLQGYKSETDFKFIKANELKRFTEAIFYTEWYKKLFPKK